jgi:hypothetical protein
MMTTTVLVLWITLRTCQFATPSKGCGAFFIMSVHTRCDGTLERCTDDLLYILKFGKLCDSVQARLI